MYNERMTLSVGQAHELQEKFRRFGYKPEEVKKACEGNFLGKVLDVIRELAEIKPTENIIDLDANPFCPEGWSVKTHVKGGKWKFDPKQIKLFISNTQIRGNIVKVSELREQLVGQSVMNANLLDWCLVHKESVPEEWKSKKIFFLGTIYRDSDKFLCVRFLFWGINLPRWGYAPLDSSLASDCPALVRVAS
jgi:hypothetical protein